MLLGLLSHRPRWGLSLRGWIVLVPLAALSALALARTIHPFLAVTARAPARVLVVEGWINDYAIDAAAAEFRSGGYDLVISTGGPVTAIRSYINDHSTAANIGAHRLRLAGLSADRVHAVPARAVERDRTFHGALALRDWLRTQGVAVRAINIVTEDVHARRTRLLFQLALGPEIDVGVVAVPSPTYDAHRWWRSSEGTRAVMSEAISYLYAKLLFFPASAPPPPATPHVSLLRSDHAHHDRS